MAVFDPHTGTVHQHHIKMHRLITVVQLLVLLLCASSGDVDSYSFPAFNATTTDDLLVVINNKSARRTPANNLFGPQSLPEFNSSEGFLLLSPMVDVWRAGDGGVPTREESFNTSFTLDGGASPVAFVLVDMIPVKTPAGFRGGNSADANATNASNALAAVEVGTLKSDDLVSLDLGHSVTITPNRTAPSRTVWIEYNAVAHRLWVYVAAGGEARPPRALLDVPLDLAITNKTYVGFFAAPVRDIILGVRDWNLPVDRFDSDGKKGTGGKKGTSWLVILLAVLGSVAATA